MIIITEITPDDESQDKLINSNLILKIEKTDEDSYGNSIIYFQKNKLEIHVNETLDELNNLINNE